MPKNTEYGGLGKPKKKPTPPLKRSPIGMATATTDLLKRLEERAKKAKKKKKKKKEQ